ncbi:hypothetical protein [Streptomyces sp. NPDC006463]|uniref:hypothetical protein n=1 Tax=Streptomyces sp. NPDC006463 TaxID=3364746 RepID=UPI0036962CC0
MRAHLTAVLAAAVTALVLTVAGCQITVEDDKAPKDPVPSAPRPEGPKNPIPNNPVPKVPTPKPTSPRPWVPKGPATLIGCGTHASGYQCSFHGYNFKPGEKVRLTLGFGNVGGHVFTADEDGEFSTNPASNTHSGTYTYVALGQQSNRQASTTVRITPGLWG